MHIGINLASRPYQDEGRFYRKWGTALAAVLVLTAFLIAMSARHYRHSRESWASANVAQAKLNELKREETQAQQILAQPQNRGTRDRSQFLNEAILRKSFSWTHLMMDLEKVLPGDVRVTSIAPVVDQHHSFVLRVEVEGTSREGAVQLVRNMEKSKQFRDAQLAAESRTQTQDQRNQVTSVKSQILTSYLPAEALEQGGE